VPHSEWGETPVAAVVLKENKRASSSIEIQNWVNNHIDARFQKLSEIMIVAELPRNIAGKVLKHELKKRHENAK
jgi:acyl-coenzyme A synthetase/AMP-(fatty) acid ligase